MLTSTLGKITRFTGRSRSKAIALLDELADLITTLHPEHVPLINKVKDSIVLAGDCFPDIGKAMRGRLMELAKRYPPYDELWPEINRSGLPPPSNDGNSSSHAQVRYNDDRSTTRRQNADKENDGAGDAKRYRSNVVCHYCGVEGHIKPRCRKLFSDNAEMARKYQELTRSQTTDIPPSLPPKDTDSPQNRA